MMKVFPKLNILPQVLAQNPLPKARAMLLKAKEFVFGNGQEFVHPLTHLEAKKAMQLIKVGHGGADIYWRRKIAVVQPKEGFWNKVKSFLSPRYTLTTTKREVYTTKVRDEDRVIKFSLPWTIKGRKIKVESVKKQGFIIGGAGGEKVAWWVINDKLAGMKVYQAFEDLLKEDLDRKERQALRAKSIPVHQQIIETLMRHHTNQTGEELHGTGAYRAILDDLNKNKEK